MSDPGDQTPRFGEDMYVYADAESAVIAKRNAVANRNVA
jgi:hypothetical protein